MIEADYPECKQCKCLIPYDDFDYDLQFCNDCSAEYYHDIQLDNFLK